METSLSIQLPKWIKNYLEQSDVTFSSPEEKMRFVIGLSRQNIEENTGGPFGAAVFEKHSNKLVSVGVNVVVSSGFSVAHAEIVALSLAQKKLSQYRLSNRQGNSYELFTSCQPCAMCLAAIPWSGVTAVVCAASEQDAKAVGFDEGQKPQNWQKALQEKGISVTLNLLRQEAAHVLQEYKKIGGDIY